LKYPGQIARRIDITPSNYECDMQAMSSEKLLFNLPGVFTIGPNFAPGESTDPGSPNMNNLGKYATFFGSVEKSEQTHTIRDIIEGELRSRCATLTLEEIFSNRVVFKKAVIDTIQEELDQFGLKIFNANIKELEDTPGSEYFSYLRQKTRAGAENDSKVAIADANNKGIVGATQKEAETRVTTAQINAKALLVENEQKLNILDSNTTLNLAIIANETRIKLQQVQQNQDIDKRRLDLEREVEIVRQYKRLEELRAGTGVDAQIQAEIVHKNSDATYYKDTKNADGDLYAKQTEAEGVKILADAKKQALQKYTQVFGDSKALLNYIMMEKGLYTDMATINAKAIKGLDPNITVWNTGGAGGEGVDPYGAIRNIFTAVPPLISTVQNQTGIANSVSVQKPVKSK